MHDPTTWQQILKTAITSTKQLSELLSIPHQNIISDFPLKVPLPFVAKMQQKNPKDPLLLQVLIQSLENLPQPGFSQDPLAEKQYNITDGIIHKYNNRALVTLAGGCAINCRYCFRRHFDYHKNQTNLATTSQAYQYLKNNQTIKEVILSGGDPLLQNDNQLAKIFANLALIPHIQTVRIHSRLPIVIPARITNEFIKVLQSTRLKSVLVVHCNHPQELANDTLQAFKTLTQNSIMVFNQSVLLKNINDNSEVLIALSEKLFQQHVMPYYLHVLDPVQGSQHFALSLAKTKQLQQELLINLPGYLVPKIVIDSVGSSYKQAIS